MFTPQLFHLFGFPWEAHPEISDDYREVVDGKTVFKDLSERLSTEYHYRFGEELSAPDAFGVYHSVDLLGQDPLFSFLKRFCCPVDCDNQDVEEYDYLTVEETLVLLSYNLYERDPGVLTLEESNAVKKEFERQYVSFGDIIQSYLQAELVV